MGQLLTAGGGNGILGNKSSTSLMYTNIDTPTASDSIKNLLSLLNVPVTYSNGTTGNQIAFLKWGGTTLDQAVSLSYSFSTATSVYAYSDSGANGVQIFSAAQTQMAQVAMSKWAAVANIIFTETSDTATNAGDIRWGATTDLAPEFRTR